MVAAEARGAIEPATSRPRAGTSPPCTAPRRYGSASGEDDGALDTALLSTAYPRARARRLALSRDSRAWRCDDMKYSVVIATYNRADDLRETLASLAKLRARRSVGSHRRRQQLPDHTRRVVEDAARPSLRRCATCSSPSRGAVRP